MSKPSPRDQINKSSWTLMESAKDATSTNLVAASQANQIDVKGPALERLLAIVNASIEEGYHRANRSFLKGVEEALAEATSEAASHAKKKQA